MDPLILGLETAFHKCSVGLASGSSLLAEESLDLSHGHAQHLMGLIQAVLQKRGVSFEELQYVAVNRGPGSFTGIRVALATAQGLCLAGELPLLGVTGFQIWRALSDRKLPLFVMIDTRRGDFYTAFFPREAEQPVEMIVKTLGEIEGYLEQFSKERIQVGGDGVDKISSHPFVEKLAYQLTSKEVIKTAIMLRGSPFPSFSSDPFYLRPPAVYETQKA